MMTEPPKIPCAAENRGENCTMTDSQTDVTPRCRVALNSVARVRQEMSKVYRAARSGTLPLGDATKLVFMLTQIGRLLADESLEKRIEDLERAATGALPDLRKQP